MKKFCFLLFILVFFTPFVFAQEDVDTSSDIPFSTAPKIVQALEAKHKGLCPYCKKDQTPICVCDEEPQYFVCCPFCRKILESIEAEPDPLPPPSQKEIDRAIKSLSRRWQQYFDAVVANDFKKIAEFAHPDILNGYATFFL